MARARTIVFDDVPMLRLVSLAGLFLLVGLCWLISKNRRAISWTLVWRALAIQAVLGALFLFSGHGNRALRWCGEQVKAFLDLSAAGTTFVFGALGSNQPVPVEVQVEVAGQSAEASASGSLGFIFATQVLPILIFFSSFMAVLYHLGVMQQIVRGMAVVMTRLLGISGAESLSACGNVFVGQTEAPLLVRPFLERMTTSEIHTIMTGGFATIAGSVFALYVGFGIDAGHLMVASVMAVPAGILCAKMMWPETEQPETAGRVVVSKERSAGNVVEAAANGATDGLRLALNVAAMLIAFLGLMAVANLVLGWFGTSLEAILGLIFWPVAAVMGVPQDEVSVLAELIGKKLVLTELVAFQDLGRMIAEGAVSERTQLIASFALCGFANVGSVAIQIGGLGAIAPARKPDIARLAFRAMFAGAIATCMNACLAGVMVG